MRTMCLSLCLLAAVPAHGQTLDEMIVGPSRRQAMESLGQASRSIGDTMRSTPRWEPPKSEVYDPGPMRWRESPLVTPSRCRRYPDGLLVCM